MSFKVGATVVANNSGRVPWARVNNTGVATVTSIGGGYTVVIAASYSAGTLTLSTV